MPLKYATTQIGTHYAQKYIYAFKRVIQYPIVFLLLLFLCKGIAMIKEILLMLIATLSVSVVPSKYLLVQLEEADEKIITPGDMYPKPEGKKQW